MEAVNRKISWLFCFSGRVCTLYKKAMNSLHRLHSVYFAAQKLSLSGHCPDKLGGICDKGYHGSRRASRWFCKVYYGKAVIVGLISWDYSYRVFHSVTQPKTYCNTSSVGYPLWRVLAHEGELRFPVVAFWRAKTLKQQASMDGMKPHSRVPIGCRHLRMRPVLVDWPVPWGYSDVSMWLES